MSGEAKRVGAAIVNDELALRALPSELASARDYARRIATDFGFDDAGCYELVYAVNEAVTNAIRHGESDEEGCILLSVTGDADRLSFSVRDSGRFVIPAKEAHNATSSRGRGFALMASLVDELQIRFEPSGTIVTLSKAFETPPPD